MDRNGLSEGSLIALRAQQVRHHAAHLKDVTRMAIADILTGTFTVKAGHAQMLKGGVIMDVVTPEQAQIAAEAGAVAASMRPRV